MLMIIQNRKYLETELNINKKNKKMKMTTRPGASVVWIIAGLFFLNISSTACKKNKTNQPEIIATDSVKHILFIGNSLTYTNNLPAIVTSIGKDSGIAIKTTTLAYPNYALEDHWNDGVMQQLIAAVKFDFVIVQQGPSSQNDGRIMLMDYGARIKTLCNKTNTQLAFFMVWPYFENLHTFDGIIKNYTDAAAFTNSLLCPVGLEWRDYFFATGDYSYSGPDKFHPSQKGSENAALIIFKTLFK